MFCFRTKKSPKRAYIEEELFHPKHSTTRKHKSTPPPAKSHLKAVTGPIPKVPLTPPPIHAPAPEPVPPLTIWSHEKDGDTKNSKAGDADQPRSEGKRVLSREELRRLRHQSNLQLYKYSLPLLAER
ncbi:hypothetical protein T265_08859 [Opisthorchis viverrini]|uniref:Uncharacterized protein n=1 Tax=Opisthorchis viverrini TaxID=6198 RepID=A0A075A716_OPIVI|nr:hypothetical protein T265_08859 [Opisthorchis viverrini]KER23209.1 hypothetical protein T265_08859 [Opisthorchis viverrini]